MTELRRQRAAYHPPWGCWKSRWCSFPQRSLWRLWKKFYLCRVPRVIRVPGPEITSFIAMRVPTSIPQSLTFSRRALRLLEASWCRENSFAGPCTGNSGSTAEFTASESRSLPSSGSGNSNRECTRGAEVPPVRCLLRRTLETVCKSVLTIRVVVPLGVCVRLRGLVRLLVSAGRRSWCLVLLSGPPVGPCRLALSSGFVLRACFFLVSEKRRRPRAPTQGLVFRQVPSLRPRYLWLMYHCRGIRGCYKSFPIVLSFLSLQW